MILCPGLIGSVHDREPQMLKDSATRTGGVVLMVTRYRTVRATADRAPIPAS
jgi:hypothetical protein